MAFTQFGWLRLSRGGFMRDHGLRIGAVVLLMAIAACAHTQPPTEPVSEASVAPNLIGCSGYTPPTFHWTESNRVSIRMRVQPDGSVDPGSLHFTPSRYDRGGHSAVVTALSFAKGCTFEPAYADGEPVEAWTNVRFAFR
jgi:hypothetical protein